MKKTLAVRPTARVLLVLLALFLASCAPSFPPPPAPGYAWVPGHWIARPYGYHWVPAHYGWYP